jgi:hypothetical protein
VLQPADQLIEIGRHLETGDPSGSLEGPHPRRQHFEIVHASQEFLRLSQNAETCRCSSGGDGRCDPARRCPGIPQFPHQLHGVSELLHSYPHFVQSIRKIDAGCVLNGGAEPNRLPGATGLGLGGEGPRAPLTGRGNHLLHRTCPERLEVVPLHTSWCSGTQPLPLLGDGRSDQRD